jgi:hypothetical protein
MLRPFGFLPSRLAFGAAATLLLGGLAAAAVPASAQVHASPAASAINYRFATVGDNKDAAFNQLLGVNDQQVIAGYFGSGQTVNGVLSPNRGYTIVPPYAQVNFRKENFPRSVQTQVTGLNDSTTTVGFYVNGAGDNIGFVHTPKGFVSVADPNTPPGAPFNQLLGVNNNNIAVGFYVNATGNSVPYEYNIATAAFTTLSIPKATSAFASGINDQNDVVGTETLSNGVVQGWTLVNGKVNSLHIAPLLDTRSLTATGINDLMQVVGFYTTSSGSTAGFVDTKGVPQTIVNAAAPDFTVVNGINNGGSIVGFYDPNAGDNCVNTCDGFVGVPTPYK